MATKAISALRNIGEWGQRPRGAEEILDEQDATRIPSLVGVRQERMAESPFAFYRGAAAVMASDLSAALYSGTPVLSCGDAHLANFGLFGTPERRMAFDVNDFDEAALAPWDWDVKRLLTSVHLAARANGATVDDAWDASRRAARAYRKALRRFAGMTSIERFYASVDTQDIQELLLSKASSAGKKAKKRTTEAAKRIGAAGRSARKHTSDKALKRFAVVDEAGQARLVDQPPLTQHVEAMGVGDAQALFRAYLGTLDPDARALLSGFEVQDVVLRVVGVGSVGTRCYIALLHDGQGTELLLQFKQAQESVLLSYGGAKQPARVSREEQGHRVVDAQRVLQAHSDRFLGYSRGAADEHSGGAKVDYYWRQFRDMKGGVDLSTLALGELTAVAQACAALLARAHAQSPGALELAPHLKGRRDVDAALATCALEYAQQTEQDHAELVARLGANAG